MKRFAQSEDGFVYVMVLLFIPVLLGVALLVIDISRGNNAHSDLYAAADAMALAGARELDGGTDAIDRAKDAMSELTNTVSMLAPSGADMHIDLLYEGSNNEHYLVDFLTEIPDDDDEPIDAAWRAGHQPATQGEAKYVWVYAQSGANHPLQPLFAVFPKIVKPTPVGATAVAMARSAACDIPPLFICNPFEAEGINLQTAFSNGQMHGRLIKLHPRGSETAGPGNFGFLQIDGSSSADAIRDMFAGGLNPTCYDSESVETKPGAATSIRTGINIRFDMYEAPYKNTAGDFPPDVNVRKGYMPSSQGSPGPCNTELYEPESPPVVPTPAMGFPPNDDMSPPGSGVAGAFIGSGDWDLFGYWDVNHPYNDLPTDLDSINSFPSAVWPGSELPSRYDIYRYEIDETLDATADLIGDASPGGETGRPMCSASKPNPAPPEEGRRIIVGAIIDCLANPPSGQSSLPVNSFASMFMVNPMEKNGTEDATIDVEIVDITGFGGNGTLDTFVRDEAVLVR